MKEEKQVAMELEWNWVEHVISVVFLVPGRKRFPSCFRMEV